MYSEPTHTIALTDEAYNNIRDIVADVIRQAQNGVTIFSEPGIIGNILFELDLTPISKD